MLLSMQFMLNTVIGTYVLNFVSFYSFGRLNRFQPRDVINACQIDFQILSQKRKFRNSERVKRKVITSLTGETVGCNDEREALMSSFWQVLEQEFSSSFPSYNHRHFYLQQRLHNRITLYRKYIFIELLDIYHVIVTGRNVSQYGSFCNPLSQRTPRVV